MRRTARALTVLRRSLWGDLRDWLLSEDVTWRSHWLPMIAGAGLFLWGLATAGTAIRAAVWWHDEAVYRRTGVVSPHLYDCRYIGAAKPPGMEEFGRKVCGDS